MQFKTVIAVALGLLSTSSFAAITAESLIADIDVLTALSTSAMNHLSSLTPSNNPGQVSDQAQTLITNMNTMTRDASGDTMDTAGTTKFSDADATLILTSLDAFTTAHQSFLTTVIKKHLIFAQFGMTAPIAAVFRQWEAAMDAFGFTMQDAFPESGSSGLSKDLAALHNSIENTVTTYAQVCVPSPLYPTVQPVCIPT
ncbi:hypothetical protein TWF694_005152 [Orbilia ellipsospora]|uniref:Uncharacterized protein n=1 Tax=Orbilia ellipsospora TaxID=2528407 RepID=A0AAV9WVU2_9PEZI